MTTALGIITSAMKKAGVFTKGETADSDEAADALSSLNNMLASWSNESLIAYSRVRESFSLVGGTASYTIGTGQTFNTARPIDIINAYITSGSIDYPPLSIIPDEAYDDIPLKTVQSIPDRLNFNNIFPAATIRLFPTPSSSYTLTLLSEKQLTSFALADTVSMPAGWERALIYNLAVEIAPEYGRKIEPIIEKVARESKGLIALTTSKVRKNVSRGTRTDIYTEVR
jgi:hypothetical protein